MLSQKEEIQYIEEQLNDPNISKEMNMFSLLYDAACDNKTDVVKYILELEDFEIDVETAWITLMTVCTLGYIDTLKLLLENSNFKPYHRHYHILDIATNFEKIDIVKYLLKDIVEEPKLINNGLVSAVGKNNTELIKVFLNNDKIDLNIKDNVIVKTISYYGNVEIFKLILESKKVSLDLCKELALRHAADMKHVGMINAYIDFVSGKLKVNKN